MMKLEAKPFNINVMQVYAPTQDHDDKEIDKFSQEIPNGIKYAVRLSYMHNGRFECKSWEIEIPKYSRNAWFGFEEMKGETD